MELTLVIPTYNEAENLGRVIREWHEALKQCLSAGQFVMLVIDDGSTDGTGKVLEEMGRIYPELSVHSQANRGHGQACLEGYRRAAALGSAFTGFIPPRGLPRQPDGYPQPSTWPILPWR
jgi:dolichol-phosphate mannosyltransferase